MQRVLMIEDDLRLGAMVATYLRGVGFGVEQAADGASGLAALDARDGPAVDLVLLDLMLPDADGLELCRRIRAHSDVPIVMVTARGDTADRIVGLELGADDYLPKPFEPRELLARIRAVLGWNLAFERERPGRDERALVAELIAEILLPEAHRIAL